MTKPARTRSATPGVQQSIKRGVEYLDRFLGKCGYLFLVLANTCLGLMLVGTSAAIILRPLGLSLYWIWPWTTVLFIWMTFFGLFAVCRLKKDIAVDFIVKGLGPRAMTASRYFVAGVVLCVMGAVLWQMPATIEAQRGPVDGAMLPWGVEVQRYYLSLPFAISCTLIVLEATLEIVKALLRVPEATPAHWVKSED